jgi:hypothetical protein
MFLYAVVFPEKPSEERKQSMLKFLEGLFANLPCPSCASHATEYYTNNPPDVSSGKSLSQWVVTFHNFVNKRIGKRGDWTVEDARKALETRYAADVKTLPRAVQIRQEDEAKIKELTARIQHSDRILAGVDGAAHDEQTGLWIIDSGGGSSTTSCGSNNNNKTETYSLTSLVLTILIFLIIVISLAAWAMMGKKKHLSVETSSDIQ